LAAHGRRPARASRRRGRFPGCHHRSDKVAPEAPLAAGLISRGARLVTGGTDNHLCLVDVSGYGLTGRQAESALLDSGIVTNRNAIPRDPNGARYTSGVRIGTPALTTRGLGTAEMDVVAGLMHEVLSSTRPGTTKAGTPSKASYELDSSVSGRVSKEATDLVAGFPLYPSVDLG
jgi:glycine hydroxymethyltransferase